MAEATFAEQIDTRFQSSWTTLVGGAKGFTLWLVEIALFLPFYAAGALLVYFVARQIWRSVEAQPTAGRKSPKAPAADAPGSPTA